MSSSKFDPRRRIALCFAGLSLLLMAGCQVRPLYSDGPSGAPATALASIGISEAKDRVEQRVRNALIFLTSGGKGEPTAPQYQLALSVSHQTTGVLFDERNDNDTASAGRLVIEADYNLTRVDTGKTVKSGHRKAVALVDFPIQEFAKLRAIRDAENRAARELAEVIRADLAAALGN
ncbi:LPS assembly lipoprotein LptE [Rhizobium sp. PP-CC-3G-465]|uniref:LPS assembly lipoprotein LptE n=1 Tax=Rhizobium sp. PP-CC-3G-465 TaxID=2135648 RepID=UPI0010443793|nr:LPS-assembly lipoprotein [Rhizobium sp. PP-CC-3G-465]